MYDVRILVAEDDGALQKILCKYLEREGYNVFAALDGKAALDIWKQHRIDLAILDVMMPGMSGFDVCRIIRQESDVPVIMLTARTDQEDRIEGFSSGADQYMPKPFSARELIARVRVILRQRGVSSADEIIEYGSLRVDKSARRVMVAGEDVDLTPREYDMLLYLADNSDRALSRNMILDRVWGYDFLGDSRTVDTFIKRLRKKLSIEGDRIVTVRGVGYRFNK